MASLYLEMFFFCFFFIIVVLVAVIAWLFLTFQAILDRYCDSGSPSLNTQAFDSSGHHIQSKIQDTKLLLLSNRHSSIQKMPRRVTTAAAASLLLAAAATQTALAGNIGGEMGLPGAGAGLLGKTIPLDLDPQVKLQKGRSYSCSQNWQGE